MLRSWVQWGQKQTPVLKKWDEWGRQTQPSAIDTVFSRATSLNMCTLWLSDFRYTLFDLRKKLQLICHFALTWGERSLGEHLINYSHFSKYGNVYKGIETRPPVWKYITKITKKKSVRFEQVRTGCVLWWNEVREVKVGDHLHTLQF